MAYHAKEISTMEVNHSSKMDAFQNRVLAMEEKQVQLINTMKTKHVEEISGTKGNQSAL
jgi:hypothetical protein